ncbi:YpjP family protein [Bacillus tianshenii]|nr:YpjP family protein [Bacillus tianshenii]
MDAETTQKKNTNVVGSNHSQQTRIPAESIVIREDEEEEDEEEQEELDNQNDNKYSKSKSWHEIAATVSADDLKPFFTEYAVEHAGKQAKEKFGPSIEGEIGDEFSTKILPKIEEVIARYADEWGEDQLRRLALSERPAGGMGEKIFHLYDRKTGEDLVRFHVRRDNPPKEGYWFNFHYHEAKDKFTEHHELGKIYWDKNTPPHWMS